jgi:hypothetical protein
MKRQHVVPIPLHFLNVLDAMNVKLKHYTWKEFYDLLPVSWKAKPGQYLPSI